MSTLATLIARLNPSTKRALEGAAQLCLAQTHFAVEVEHLLLKLVEQGDGDLPPILRYYGIDSGALQAQLTATLDRLKRGNSRTPAFSDHIVRLLQSAWLVSSLDLSAPLVRSGAILKALLDDDALRGLLLEPVPLLAKIPRGRLAEDLPELIKGSAEDVPGLGAALPNTSPKATNNPILSSTATQPCPALDAYTIDLTAQARAGKSDPVVGRDGEIRQLIDVLMRRRQNNPILTGDPGVGKTAVVEGLAQRIVEGAVPPPLKPVRLLSLDLGLLQAGAGVRGEFEDRLKRVIQEVAQSACPIILFIDEAHSLIGAGGSAGQGDAANLLKPALARGELRTIAATTWAEYKKYFEKDPALARRFQVVKVDEPDEATAVAMLRGLVPKLEAHHGVRVLDEAVADAVRLSHRYITGRQLPDKAIGVLDTACARVAIAQNGEPPALEAARREVRQLTDEIALLGREKARGRDHGERIEALEDRREQAQDRLEQLRQRWVQEGALAARVRELEERLAAGTLRGADFSKALDDLEGLRLELEQIQQDETLVPLSVDHRAVAAVVSGWTGIPVGRMLTDNIAAVRRLRQRMAERVVGQDDALDAVARRIQTYYASLAEPGKPTGVFLLVGPSGVGKTETALALADLLFGGERAMVTINMSEYQEAHSVSGLKGAPPGYVGYGRGGVLTEAVRRNPYAVVLLDEVEKAHADVLELFYQVFDKGVLEDGEGVPVDFKNTVILLTSNLGAEIIHERAAAGAKAEMLVEAIRPALVRHFKPALLGRMVVVPYLPLPPARLGEIVRLKLSRIQARMADAYQAELTYDEAVVAYIVARCRAADAGARAIDQILTNNLLPQLSGEVLERLANGAAIDLVHVATDPAGAGLVVRFGKQGA
ncbi:MULTISPECIES: type VI secretion system ATPase TssH [unclassified Azospirillum]|uniref:type VI secretion system ATPase TssH n=1 Tax=unclassified Azospirillum TaxID=2630922 RepID=UPI000B6FDD3F|nr:MULTISPECIES: type VI secretion system ATPase TssH [unclassified Azospirillum]SNS13039.1 type VI secretion system protein VasG [Azospirillum sp. RU38E]SNS30093.1 type VI secretion system protein VasG [Azospirillum sp. RU37A]